MVHRYVRAIMLGLTLVGGMIALSPATRASIPSWDLVDNHQSDQFVLGNPSAQPTGTYHVWIKGSWPRSANVGISDLPSGATYWTSGAPIPPGSNDGVDPAAEVAVQLAPTNRPGTYVAKEWVQEGTTGKRSP